MRSEYSCAVIMVAMMENEIYSKACSVISKNIGNRKLVMRWKDESFEKYLYSKTGIKVDFYLTRSNSRVDNVATFADEVIDQKNDQYYLVLTSALKWNRGDYERYQQMGYSDITDMYWFSHKPQVYKYGDGVIADEYGNYFKAESNAKVVMCGINSCVSIGKNVVLPDKTINIGSNVRLVIGDNSRLYTNRLIFASGASLTIGKNVYISEMEIFVNSYSSVEIGDNTSMQTGKLRTGRNQSIKIGKGCMFSWDIIFLPHDGHLLWDVTRGKCTNNTTGKQRPSIIIKDHVWIGGETVIMPNTVIETGSVCGYRSMVKGKIPNNCIVAGTPAKVIKRNIAWSKENVSFDDNDFYKIDEQYRKMTQEDEVK